MYHVKAFILFIIMLSPMKYDGVVKDKCDFVEINHYYQYDHAEKAYQKQFIQAIWWEFRGGLFINRKGRDLSKPIHDFVVKDYRVMWSRTSVPQAVNTITPRRYKNKWVCVFYDKNDRMLREITSGWVVVTHTVFDPEMKNRTVIDIQHRSKLSDPREARLER